MVAGDSASNFIEKQVVKKKGPLNCVCHQLQFVLTICVE